MRETTVEGHLKTQVEARGGRCIKLNPRWLKGIPDRLVVLPGRHVEFVETKTPEGLLRPAQRKWQGFLADLGFTVHYPRTKGEVNLLLIRWRVVK